VAGDCMVCIACSGQMPAEADFNLLDTARKVEVYGIRMHQAKVHVMYTVHWRC